MTHFVLSKVNETPTFNEYLSTYGLAVAIVAMIVAGVSIWFIRHKMEQLAEDRRHRKQMNDLEIEQRKANIVREEALTTTMVETRNDMKDIVALQIRTLDGVAANSQHVQNVETKVDRCVERVTQLEDR